MADRRPSSGPGRAPRPRVATVGLVTKGTRRPDAEVSLDELGALAAAAGTQVVLQFLQERPQPDPASFLGRGKVELLATACAEADVDTVVFDNELTPAQLRNLQERLQCTIVDRTQLILDIFARRARTREGQLQVELAQLRYLLPRLVGMGAALSRLGGGIGTRGPGETKLETDRRRIRARIHSLEETIESVRQRRGHLRDRRRKDAVPTAALVGYTNAGKTTLFNRLTGADAVASDALFVTLDPLVRRVSLGAGREFLLSDTVGFINRLPHALVAAFRATLEETAAADLILHVIDAADPDRATRVAAVERVLGEVNALELPRLDIFNKADRLSAAERRALREADPDRQLLSATTGEGLDGLRRAIEQQLALDPAQITLQLDLRDRNDARKLAWVHRHGRVLAQRTTAGGLAIDAELPRRLATEMVTTVAGTSAPAMDGPVTLEGDDG